MVSLNLLTMKFFMLMAIALLGNFYCIAQTDSVSIVKTLPSTRTSASVKPSIELYPNPTKNKAELQLKGFEQGVAQLTILNTAGIAESVQQRLLIGGKETLVIMFQLPAGIHYVVLQQKSKMVKVRMVVQ
jgi:hypothetical protein